MEDMTKSLNNQNERPKKKRKYKPSIAGYAWKVTINRKKNMKIIRTCTKGKRIKELIIKILQDASRKPEYLTIKQIEVRMREEITQKKLDIDLKKVNYKTIYNYLKGSRDRLNCGSHYLR